MHTVSPEYLAALRAPYLPELPEQAAFDVLERARSWESLLITGSNQNDLILENYRDGSAVDQNEVLLCGGQNIQTLITAEHATDVVRKATNKIGAADHGTAALAGLLVEDTAATSLISIGRQTGNAAIERGHPIKKGMKTLLHDRQAFGSVHGMLPGKVTQLGDEREVHAIVGLGRTPNEQSRQAAEDLVRFANEIGLRVIIGNDMSHFNIDATTGNVRVDGSGLPITAKLAALPEHSTTNFAYELMTEQERQIPAMQLEITRGLRLIPSDLEAGWHKDQKARAMGVYAGYLLVRQMVTVFHQK